MITRLSEMDKQKVVAMYARGMSLNDIRVSVVQGREVAQKTVRNALLDRGYGVVIYCQNCRANKPFIGAVRGGREFCNDCGKYIGL